MRKAQMNCILKNTIQQYYNLSIIDQRLSSCNIEHLLAMRALTRHTTPYMSKPSCYSLRTHFLSYQLPTTLLTNPWPTHNTLPNIHWLHLTKLAFSLAYTTLLPPSRISLTKRSCHTPTSRKKMKLMQRHI